MEQKPEVMKKIYPILGEITVPNFGLSDEHFNRVIDSTEIVFHLAASLKLEATLKPNILMNLTGTKNVLDVAKQMQRLLQMIHTSTAFCNIENEVMEEKIYDFPHRPEDLIRCAEWMSEEALAVAQKDILTFHPNTYTYTKRLAEILVRDEYNKVTLPVCVVRPSIVGPAYQEPLPGWVDSLNGPPGIMIAGAKGVLRCLMLDVNSHLEGIPCDTAINALIMIAKHLATSKRFGVVNCVAIINPHKSNLLPFT
jgi:alcohol-forming fatty acyl-CoA reductase